MKTMIVDSHQHVMLPTSMQVKKMDDAGVDKAILFLKILSRGNVRLNFYLFSFLYSFKGNRRHSYREAAVITSIILALPPGHSSVL